MNKKAAFLSLVLTISLGTEIFAGSATWSSHPASNLWDEPENWTPATVPNANSDVATFAVSDVTDVAVGLATTLAGAENMVDRIVFSPGASAYTLTAKASQGDTYYSDFLEFQGAGIVNGSGKVQNLVTEAAVGPEEQQAGGIFFGGSSSAGENAIITNRGSASTMGATGPYGGWTAFSVGSFTDTPSAGKATFINEGGKVAGTIYGGTTELFAYSTAEAATFINQPGVVDGAAAGHTYLTTGGSIGSSTFINNPATVTGAEGGWSEIDIGICAGASFIANGATSAGPQGGQVYSFGGEGYASFTAKGGQGSGAQGGLLELHNIANSIQTIVTAEAGSDGGLGGMISLQGIPSSLDQVQFQMLGNGTMDLSELAKSSVTIGSLSGAGTVTLARVTLTIGSNNLSTTYAGVIQDAGGISKIGQGTLGLSGANSYRHGTVVEGGVLLAQTSGASATGTGPVQVNAGTLGGKGMINGPVTIGTGSGSGAILAPSMGSKQPLTLSLSNTLTCKADSTYTCQLSTQKRSAAQVIAKGVTLASGAQFALQVVGNKRLPSGTAFTILSNTSATPISGAFANLPNGSTLTAGRNKLLVSYSGGDGNDLTLTVQ